jgi:hypothetical protein
MSHPRLAPFAVLALAALAPMTGCVKQTTLRVKNASTLKVCHTDIGKAGEPPTRELFSEIEPAGERTFPLKDAGGPAASFVLRFYTCDETLLAEKTVVAGQDSTIIVP